MKTNKRLYQFIKERATALFLSKQPVTEDNEKFALKNACVLAMRLCQEVPAVKYVHSEIRRKQSFDIYQHPENLNYIVDFYIKYLYIVDFAVLYHKFLAEVKNEDKAFELAVQNFKYLPKRTNSKC